MNRSRLTRFIFLLLFATLSFSCSKTETVPLGRLKISFNMFPVTPDPRKSGDFVSSCLICMIYDGLTRCLPDGSVEFAIAERLEISANQLTYTFFLRHALWSDGSPVTAYDFERSWKRVLAPDFPSMCPYLLYPIKNAESSRKGLISSDQIGIRALNDRTLEVTLERPTPYFLSLTSFPTYLPVPPQADVLFNRFGSNEPLVCNGPFLLDHIQPNAELLLKKNYSFWNAPQIHLSEVQISIISNETTAWQMFERGELDWLGGAISPLPVDLVTSMPPGQTTLRSDPMAATTFCAFHTQHPYLSNRNLRRAFALAINRTEIIEQITQLGEAAATRFIPPSLLGNRDKTLYQPYDPELSRLHFAKALQELKIDLADLNGLSLSFSNTRINRQIAQALQRQWKEILGVDINLKQFEGNSFKDQILRRDYELALHFWIAQYSDPINILERFQDMNNVKNLPGWFNESYRSLVQAAIFQNDRLERMDLIESAERIIADEMPLAPIYHWTNPSLCQPWVQNMKSTPNGGVLFERCWISQKYTQRD